MEKLSFHFKVVRNVVSWYWLMSHIPENPKIKTKNRKIPLESFMNSLNSFLWIGIFIFLAPTGAQNVAIDVCSCGYPLQRSSFLNRSSNFPLAVFMFPFRSFSTLFQLASLYTSVTPRGLLFLCLVRIRELYKGINFLHSVSVFCQTLRQHNS